MSETEIELHAKGIVPFFPRKNRDSPRKERRVAVVGGGLAGMAAAVALAEQGCGVDLFERKRRLGGRVGSFRDPKTGQWVDHSMHVSMGCCTNFLDFVRRTGVADCFRRDRRLHFVGPKGEVCRFNSWPWLPAPLHLLPGFARLKYLSLGERLSIGRCLLRMGRLGPDDWRHGPTAGEWLRRQAQSEAAIERFWSVVIVSALGETVERAAMVTARQVFLDGFLRSARGYEVLIPRVPLSEIFDRRVGDYLRRLGVNVRLGCPVRSIEMDERRAKTLTTADGERHTFDSLILAVPWTTIGWVLSPEQQTLLHPDWRVGGLESSAITAVHVWLDRAITSLPHAALVGRTSQWIFSGGQSQAGHYYQVVISASGRLADMPRDRLLETVLEDLAFVWPEAGSARVLHHRIVTERDAVFSVTPEGQRCRPKSSTDVPNTFLAGDWTGGFWPATMEGAIFSGYDSARMVVGDPNGSTRLPVAGLKPSWLARLMFSWY